MVEVQQGEITGTAGSSGTTLLGEILETVPGAVKIRVYDYTLWIQDSWARSTEDGMIWLNNFVFNQRSQLRKARERHRERRSRLLQLRLRAPLSGLQSK